MKTDKLFLDHLYCTLPTAAFAELQSFFKPILSTDSYWVETGHGKWHGIYAFPVKGGFLEFLEESARDSKATHGIAFSQHGEESSLDQFLETRIQAKNWTHVDRRKPDGSLWYKSSFLEKQDPQLFLWGMDYFGEHGRTIRQKGELSANPLVALKKVAFRLMKPLFEKSASLLEGWATLTHKGTDKTEFVISQKGFTDLLLVLTPSEIPDPAFEIEIEVTQALNADFESLKVVKGEIHENVLKLSYGL
jgi:hypothetical protein